MKRNIFAAVAAVFLLLAPAAHAAAEIGGFHPAESQPGSKSAVVYFNQACQDCAELVNAKYPRLFAEYGYALENRDYINERANRKLLTRANEAWGVPFGLQSHIETFVGGRLLLAGHIPEPVMRYALENPSAYDKLLIYQDEMHGEVMDYKVWDFQGDIKTYPAETPLTAYLGEAKDAGRNPNPAGQAPQRGFWKMFSLVTASAFFDGLNPCAFAVLLFFVAFLFALKKTKGAVWKMGAAYVFAVFLAYLLIGVGLAKALIISGSPHLMAYVGAYLIIALGLIQLAGVVWPSFPIKLHIPGATKAALEKWLYKATIPAALVGGFLVGLCTFPCSGGIYVAIIGLLASTQTYLRGLAWMIWYNLVFVAPLVILLLLSTNRRTTEKLLAWEQTSARKMRIISGIVMLLLGAVLLAFFV